VVIKVLVNVAAALEASEGFTKVDIGVGSAVLDRLGHVAIREEPHLNEIARPLHGINTAVAFVEASASRVSICSVDGATIALADLFVF